MSMIKENGNYGMALDPGDRGLNPHRKDAKDAKKGKTWEPLTKVIKVPSFGRG
jgi:hypothetical protein